MIYLSHKSITIFKTDLTIK